MTIIRVEKKTTYVPVLKRAIDDPRLPLAAKGLWAYLEAHPELADAGIKADDLERRGVGDADEIQHCLEELIQAGYLEVR